MNADNYYMTVKEQIPIILGVLSDWRVIVTTVAMILVITFTKFITTYKKKNKAPKPAKVKAAPVAAPEDNTPKTDISENDV